MLYDTVIFKINYVLQYVNYTITLNSAHPSQAFAYGWVATTLILFM